jgi:hypothetical protein
MPGGDDKQRIRERAYELWEREGRPHGRHIDHWMQAERETGGPGAEGIARAGEGDAGLFGEEPGSRERGSRQPSGGAERGFGAAASHPARPHEPGQGVVDKPSRSRRKTGEELSESGAKRNQRRKE